MASRPGRILLGEGVECRREEIVVGGLLKGAGEAQQPRLVVGMADELQADGQAIARESAGQGNGAQVEEIDGNGVAQAEAVDGEIDVVAVNLVENRGGKRGGRGDEKIDVFEGRAGFAAQLVAYSKLTGESPRREYRGRRVCAPRQWGRTDRGALRGCAGDRDRLRRLWC